MSEIIFTEKVSRCDNCPAVETEKTPSAGMATDYYCTATKKRRKIAGYIEWENREMPDIPKWCPFRKEKKDV